MVDKHNFNLLVIVTGIIVAYIISSILYNIFLHPLRHYPGSIYWRATRLTWVIALHRGHLHSDLLRLHERYGPVVRTAPNELSYIDARAWRDIYTSRPGSAVLERGDVWFPRRPGRDPPMILMGNSEAGHARLRRAFIGAFSDTATKEVHAPVIEKYVHLWIGQFKAMIEKNGKENGGTSAEPAETRTNTTTTVDMISWLNFLTFDISGDLSFGESFGSTARGEPHAWVDIANGYGKGIALIASLNYFVAPLQKLLRFVMPASVRRKMAYHQDWTAQKVRKRLEFKNDRADFMGAVLKYNNQSVKTKEEKVSIQELELNMATFVFAGSETTSSALAVVLFELLKAPDILKRVQDEVRSAFEREKDVDVASCSKLEYLSAVINEGIRIGPPSVIGVPRVVKGHGEEVCGKWVPGGTYLAVNQYAAFHATANFTDPSKFQPERFLTPDADAKTSDDNLAVFQPFLVGRHTCIGQKFAWAEMRLVLARLLFAFDISRAETNSATVNVGDWGEQKTFIFWEKEPLHVSLKKRVS